LVSSAGGAAAQSNEAAIRVVHTSPDVGTIDVWIDGKATFNGMKLGTFTDATTVAAGSHDVAIVPKGGALDTAVLKSTIELTAGAAYEVAIVDTKDKLAIQLYSVDLSPVAEGVARTRFIHTSPDAPNIDAAIVDGPQLGSGLAFLDAGDNVDVNAGTHGVALTEAGTGTAVLTANGVPFNSDKVYDIFLIGRVADKNLTILPIISSPSTATGGTTQVPATGVGMPRSPDDKVFWALAVAAMLLVAIGLGIRYNRLAPEQSRRNS
jgi:hypothetical protein